MNTDRNYILGLDLGVASIGWAAILIDEEKNPCKILDTNSIIFTSLDNEKGKLHNADRRQKRGLRRVTRRRVERLRRIKSLLFSAQIISDKNFDTHGGENMLLLKVKGLQEQLTLEELARCLVHYAKHRGFKSNRKVEDADKETQKMKGAIKHVQSIMQNQNCSLSSALLHIQVENKKDTIRNSTGDYTYSFDRADVEEEAKKLLNKQQEYYPEQITDTFIETYMGHLLAQRDFSMGPGEGSKYTVSFEKMMGMCKFRTNETRIVRSAPSFELFQAYQVLMNLTYYNFSAQGKGYKEKKELTNEQVQTVIKNVLESKTKKLKYQDILTVLTQDKEERDAIVFVNLPTLDREKYKKKLETFKEKNHYLEKNLTPELLELFQKEVMKERMKQEVISLDNTRKLMDTFGPEAPFHQLDQIATVLSFAQTDVKIDEYITERFPELEVWRSEIKKLTWKNKGTGSLSTSLVQDLNQEFARGHHYAQAMENLGFEHYEREVAGTFKSEKFPTISQIEEVFTTQITQPNVKHVLTILRKLYRQLVQKYGVPAQVNIELARDLRKPYKERLDISRSQMTNRLNNQRITTLLTQNYLEQFDDLRKNFFTAADILKVKLYEEQGGKCIYTGQKINQGTLLTNEYQIDHILPYSRTFDDSQNNKVLCTATANQNKRNRTPYEWLSKEEWKHFVERVKNEPNIRATKKEKLLFNGELKREDFMRQQLHATSYVAKVCKNVFEGMLGKNNVQVYKGQMTSYLRKYYQLNSLTHSLESPDLQRTSVAYKLEQMTISSDEKKIVFSASAKTEQGIEIETKYEVPSVNQIFTDMIRYADKTQEIYNDKFSGENLQKITHKNYVELVELCNQDQVVAGVVSTVIQQVIDGLKLELEVKSRNHHLHHALDAVLLAIMNKSMEQKIVKFSQYLYAVQTGNEQIFDENGEIITRQDLEKEFVFTKNRRGLPELPVPYQGFVSEVEARIFQKDQHRFTEMLRKLPMYTEAELEALKVNYPYHLVNRKMKRGLHMETIYGQRIDNNNEKQAVYRQAVEEIKKVEDLEWLVDRQSGQKIVYETLKQWFKSGRKTEPCLPNGRKIKKVRMYDKNPEKFLVIDQKCKKLAQISELYRILVFKKEGTEKLFFAQIDNFRQTQLQQGNFDFEVTLWYGQAKNKETKVYSQLANEGYIEISQLIPNEIILLKLKNGAKGYCRVAGFTSGQLEIKSILGDGLDLLKNELQGKINRQFKITVSTIQSIQQVQQTILGEFR